MMNNQNSKEDNSTQNNQSFDIQSKHTDTISHCIAFNQQKGLITIGNQGQLNLYLRNYQGQYQHKSTNKVFYAPVVAYDLFQEGHNYKLLLVSFDNRVAACKIKNNQQIIVYRYFKLQQKQAIATCVWGNLQNEIILGGQKEQKGQREQKVQKVQKKQIGQKDQKDQKKQKGYLFILDIFTNKKLRESKLEEAPLKLLRFGRDEVYLCAKNHISKLFFDEIIKQFVIISQTFLGQTQIVDCAISQQQLYNSLVILTQKRIYFLELEQLKTQPQFLELKNKVKGGKLSWGKDYSEIGIYETYKKSVTAEVYSKNLSGVWELVQY